MRLDAKRDVPPCSLTEHLRISLLPQFSTFFDGHNRPVWRVSTSFGSTEFSPMKCRLARGVGRFHFCYFFITRRCSVAASTKSPPRARADMSDLHVPISYRSTQTGDKEHAPLEDPVLPAIAAGADRYVVKPFADAALLVTEMAALLNSPRIWPAVGPRGGR